jgi:alkanesulfonate monooxygenase SsuD/methylene tetrahydromethanopterin reductase-like flavin-dependent oxidoreductase (luciferase family)
LAVTVMVDENATPDVIPDEMKQGMVVGGADAVAEQLKAKVFDAGIDGVIMNLPTSIQGYQPGHITALGEALKPLVSA